MDVINACKDCTETDPGACEACNYGNVGGVSEEPQEPAMCDRCSRKGNCRHYNTKKTYCHGFIEVKNEVQELPETSNQ